MKRQYYWHPGIFQSPQDSLHVLRLVGVFGTMYSAQYKFKGLNAESIKPNWFSCSLLIEGGGVAHNVSNHVNFFRGNTLIK